MEMITEEEVRELIRQMVDNEITQGKVAKRLRISPAYLSDIIRGRRDVSDYIAHELGYKKIKRYEKVK